LLQQTGPLYALLRHLIFQWPRLLNLFVRPPPA
jgi:hypothetical protein